MVRNGWRRGEVRLKLKVRRGLFGVDEECIETNGEELWKMDKKRDREEGKKLEKGGKDGKKLEKRGGREDGKKLEKNGG
ncbi:hypothetical protein Pmani_026435 [Petrolisthes manimaculis]|uniref:Uncharacterized protein n=1 Tax=Petrolisthes manimaculis TaxID=1843537 RepID=A0AAE1P623_9EUCA|nr:hypothetical protein Pmani_026435 [Petrolisthes manimaculis]